METKHLIDVSTISERGTDRSSTSFST
jgi:hypothetical protein